MIIKWQQKAQRTGGFVYRSGINDGHVAEEIIRVVANKVKNAVVGQRLSTAVIIEYAVVPVNGFACVVCDVG